MMLLNFFLIAPYCGIVFIFGNFFQDLTLKQTLENTERQSKMDNPEKLAIQGTQDEEKNTTQNVSASNIITVKINI